MNVNAQDRHRFIVLAAVVPVAITACQAPSPSPAPQPGVLLSLQAADFPPIFDPVLWDLDPRLGDAVVGTAFTADGGRRTGILQLFVFNTLNLNAFIQQELAQAGPAVVATSTGAATLTQAGPSTRFTQTLRAAGGQRIHEGEIRRERATIVSFTHNQKTGAFDGTYRSPVDRNTRHRMIVVPLADGRFVGGSVYDLLDDGRATYTHLGLLDEKLRPLRLLEFVQVNEPFDTAAAALVGKVQAAVASESGAEVPAGGTGDVQAGAGAAEGADGDGRFPDLLDLRFFQLDLAAVGAPGNAGAIFGVVNAVARNAIEDIRPLLNNSPVKLEVDARGRRVEVRSGVIAGTSFEARQTFEQGVQDAVITVSGRKRLQFSRNHRTGAFEGVIIAPSFDLGAPVCAIVTPNGDGTSRHLIVEDIANNLKNDYRGEVIVDSRTLEPKSFVGFQQFQGGLAAQPESQALVTKFGFAGIVKGF